MFRKLLLGLAFSFWALPALAQGCGAQNPNCIVPTRPVGDSTNAAASTAFVQQALAPSVYNYSAVLSGTAIPGLNANMALSGTALSGYNANVFNISSDTVNADSGFGNGFLSQLIFGGSTAQGGRQAIVGLTSLTATTSASSSNRDYVGVQGVGQSSVNDNGTGLTTSTAAGAIFGVNGIGVLNNGATDFLNVTGAEFNSRIVSGASAALKSLLQISSDALDRVQGSVVDTMFWAYNQNASNPGFNVGIYFDNAAGLGAWPIVSTGTIIKTGGGGSAAIGIDLSNTTFSTASFKSSGFLLDGSGNIQQTIATTFQPVTLMTNTTNDNGSANIILQKNRAGGNTSNADYLGIVQFNGYANSAQQSVARIQVNQNAASSGSNIPTAMFFTTSSAGGQLNQQLEFDQNAHFDVNHQAVAPTANSCSGFTLGGGANDFGGSVTFTSATSCSINFGASYLQAAPHCVVAPGSAASTVEVATTESSLTATFGTAQTAMTWICVGL